MPFAILWRSKCERREEDVLEDARIGDIVFSSRTRRLGPAPSQWLCDAGQNSAALYELDAGSHLPYGEILFDLDISPDGTLLAASVSQINGDQRCGLPARRSPRRQGGRHRHFDFGTATPEGSSYRRTGAISSGAPTTPACRTSSAMSWRAEDRSGQQCGDGIFRRSRKRTGRHRLEYTGQGFTPVVIDPRPLEDLSAVKFLGAEVAKNIRSSRPGRWIACGVPLDEKITKRDKYVRSMR